MHRTVKLPGLLTQFVTMTLLTLYQQKGFDRKRVRQVTFDKPDNHRHTPDVIEMHGLKQ
jgi:hypothetical protein